jgi:hypothetical protein
MSAFQRKCPLCGGDLIRSAASTLHFWRKPWGRKLFDWGGDRVYPWACMGCGVVLLYLDQLPAVADEYKKAREREQSVAGKPQPAHFKS